ncbi:MAG: PilT/PilU family type 4a pilus ATPase [Candidatus Omnitrophota bacterium]
MADDLVYILGDQAEEPQKSPSSPTVPASQDQDDVVGILKSAVSRRASDIHFQVGRPPIFRIDGILSPFTQAKPVTSAFMTHCIDQLLTADQKKNLLENRQLDCSIALPNFTHRFRVNFFFQLNSLSGAFRINPTTPPTMEQLGLPPFVQSLASLPNGLVLISGSTGSGKSTTLAAIVEHINKTKNAHIITLSDPIEYIHKGKQGMLSQREIGIDASSFANALRVVLREDPDVIVVEEIRDLETIAMALTAAETGNLVFATLHTNDAVQAINRIIDVFPPIQQSQIKTQLAMTLQAVVSQMLVRKKDGSGRMAVFETMLVTTPIRNLIRDDQVVQIYNVISTSRAQGMILMRDALKECVQNGFITPEEAEACSRDTEFFRNNPHNWRRPGA